MIVSVVLRAGLGGLPPDGLPRALLESLASASRKLVIGMVFTLIGTAVVYGVALALLGVLFGAGLLVTYTLEDLLGQLLIYLIIILVVLAIFTIISGFFFYKGGRELRETLAGVEGVYGLGTPVDLIYYGGLAVLIGGLLTIVLIGIVLAAVGWLLLAVGLALLGVELKKLDERFSGAANALIAGTVVSIVSLVAPSGIGGVLSLLGPAIMIYGLYQLSSTAALLAAEAAREGLGEGL